MALERLSLLSVDEGQLRNRLDLFYSPSVPLGGLLFLFLFFLFRSLRKKKKEKEKKMLFTREVESLFLCPDFKEFAGPHDTIISLT